MEEYNGINCYFVDLLYGMTIGRYSVTDGIINGWSVNPETDDYIVQLGHATDAGRRNAIIISSYAENVLDSRQSATNALKPPYLAQY
jgi:hypothetical protein